MLNSLNHDSFPIEILWGVISPSPPPAIKVHGMNKDSSIYAIEKYLRENQETIFKKSLEREEKNKVGILKIKDKAKGDLSFLYGQDLDLDGSRLYLVAIEVSFSNLENLLEIFVWFESIITKALNFSCILDNEGCIIRVTNIGCRQLGFTHEELKGINFEDLLVSPRNLPLIIKMNKKKDNAEICLKTKSGQILIGMGGVSAFYNEQGDVIFYFFTITDITQQMNTMSNSLRNNMELEERNTFLIKSQVAMIKTEKLATIGMLGAGLAHEINNPLSFINNDLILCKDYIDNFQIFLNQLNENYNKDTFFPQLKEKYDMDYSLEELGEMIDEMKNGVDRIGKIVHSLKSFSGNEQAEDWGFVDINKALQEMLVVSKNEYKYDIKIETDFQEVPLIYCNFKEINQALLSIFLNSINAVHEKHLERNKGKIKIKTALGEDNSIVKISFIDNGVDVDPSKVKQFFEPFYTSWDESQSNGMGLTMANDIIVTKHHGDIEFKLESEKCVMVSLPNID
jgi:PAS domain S-box-containing protein